MSVSGLPLLGLQHIRGFSSIFTSIIIIIILLLDTANQGVPCTEGVPAERQQGSKIARRAKYLLELTEQINKIPKR